MCGDLDQIAAVGGAGLLRRLQASMKGPPNTVLVRVVRQAGEITRRYLPTLTVPPAARRYPRRGNEPG